MREKYDIESSDTIAINRATYVANAVVHHALFVNNRSFCDFYSRAHDLAESIVRYSKHL